MERGAFRPLTGLTLHSLAAASGASPNLSPAKPYSHLARESAPQDACPSRSGRAAAGYSTADPLPLREVLRGTGQQGDLQGLCSRVAS
jgi:hypothetical protein